MDTVHIGFVDQAATYDFALDGDFNVIPEPSTYALKAFALAGIVGIGRRCKNAAQRRYYSSVKRRCRRSTSSTRPPAPAPSRTHAATAAYVVARPPALACSVVGPHVRRSLDRLRLKLPTKDPVCMLSLADLHEKLAGPELLDLDPADASSTADANTVLGSLTDSLDRHTQNRGWAFLD